MSQEEKHKKCRKPEVHFTGWVLRWREYCYFDIYCFQAKLLSMTREEGSSGHTYHHRSYSPESRHPPSNKAFSKTTVAWQPAKTTSHSLVDPDDSSPLDTPAPRARAPRPTINTSDIEIKAARAKSPKSRSPKSRSPKRSSPKSKSRSPVRDRKGNHGIH